VAVGQYYNDLDCIKADSVGIYIEDISTGEVLLDVNGEKPMIPASITKVITASSLFNNVSPASVIETKIYIAGTVVDGSLRGNVLINAVGDPTIESKYFPEKSGFADSIADVLVRFGIKEINGGIVIKHSSRFESQPPSGWLEDDFVWPYGAMFQALNYADNKFTLSMPNGLCEPQVPGLTVKRLRTNKAPACVRKPDSKTVVLNRKASRKGSHTLANPDPEASMRADLRAAFNRVGIIMHEHIGTDVPTPLRLIYNYRSPEIRDIVKVMMQRSHNLMAEGMLMAAFPDATRSEATVRELAYWGDCGADTTGVFVEDGSGLSRLNRITPYFMADVLSLMCESPYSGQFVESFPLAGVSGTLKYFLSGTPLEGRIALKTGSMNNVQCYAGYMLDSFGEPSHLVVIMINGFRVSRAAIKKSVEKLLLDKFS